MERSRWKHLSWNELQRYNGESSHYVCSQWHTIQKFSFRYTLRSYIHEIILSAIKFVEKLILTVLNGSVRRKLALSRVLEYFLGLATECDNCRI